MNRSTKKPLLFVVIISMLIMMLPQLALAAGVYVIAPPVLESILVTGPDSVEITFDKAIDPSTVPASSIEAQTFTVYAGGSLGNMSCGLKPGYPNVIVLDPVYPIPSEGIVLVIYKAYLGYIKSADGAYVDSFSLWTPYYRGAETPEISIQPADVTVDVGGTANLTVAASAGTGSISYQWYSNSTNSNTGGDILTDETGAGFSVPTTTSGTTYYYCIITNTDNTAPGSKTTTSTTRVAKVVVSAPTSYTVTFKDWNDHILKSEPVASGGTATPPTDPSRTGYTFQGWSETLTNITADLTVYAHYHINVYTVIFRDWNEIKISSEQVDYLHAATAPANPTRSGYTFSGWDKSFNSITANLTVYATYTKNSTPTPTPTPMPKPRVSNIVPTQTVFYTGTTQLAVSITALNTETGAKVKLQLLNSSHHALSPAIVQTGTLDANGKVKITLTLPDDLTPGTYYLASQVVGSTMANSEVKITILETVPKTGETSTGLMIGLLMMASAVMLLISKKILSRNKA